LAETKGDEAVSDKGLVTSQVAPNSVFNEALTTTIAQHRIGYARKTKTYPHSNK